MIPMTFARLNRRRRFEDRRPRWSDIPEEPDDEGDYDRFGMMNTVDNLDRGWRDLVNEHGFTAVVKARSDTGSDLAAATAWLKRRHETRQWQLAHGSY